MEYFDVASEKWNESTSMLFRRGLAGATEMDGKTEGCGWVGGGLMVFCSLTWGKGGGAWIGAIQFPISSPIQNKVKILRHTQDSQKLTTFIKTISL